MTARAVMLAWLTAALIIAGAIAFLIVGSSRQQPAFHGVEVAVIGSSLMRHAVPKREGGEGGLLGNGWRHWRIGLSSITENDLISLLSRALDEHVKIVFVDANPLLFDFAKSPGKGHCDRAGAELRSRLKAMHLHVTDEYARRFGKPAELDEVSAADEVDHAGLTQPVRLRGIYPLSLRGPCRVEALERLGAKAKTGGQSIVVVLPPRSATSDRLLGPIQRRDLNAWARFLAGELHAQLFDPKGTWTDSEFVDGEHLNRRGRAHFIAALRAWWRTQR